MKLSGSDSERYPRQIPPVMTLALPVVVMSNLLITLPGDRPYNVLGANHLI